MVVALTRYPHHLKTILKKFLPQKAVTEINPQQSMDLTSDEAFLAVVKNEGEWETISLHQKPC